MSSLHLRSTAAPARTRTLVLRGLLLLVCVFVVLQLSRRAEDGGISTRTSNKRLETASFSRYLDKIVPLDSAAPHLVLTSADSQWLAPATAALQLSLNSFNDHRELMDARMMEVVVLTSDSGAQKKCRERGWNCYAGFQHTGPSSMSGGTREWLKVAGE